jgi:ribosome maturation factor RimP
MVSDIQNQRIESMVQSVIGVEEGYFLVEIKIKPINNIKVFVDGDNGITIEKCVQFNRAIYKKLEASDLFPSGDFSLEVSSPGLDEPIKSVRQYQKNVGRNIEVLLQDGNKKEGRLIALTGEGIIVEETKGKNKLREFISHTFLFNDIKSTKIQIVF